MATTQIQKTNGETKAMLWPDMDQMRTEMAEMMRDMFSGNWFSLPNVRRLEQFMPTNFQPSLNVRSEGGNLVVETAVPGMDKKDIHLTVTRDSLTLRGEYKKEEKSEKDKVFHSEIHYGSFSRSLALPAEVDANKVKAELKDGMLTIHMPLLKPEAHQQIKVDVK